jgi:hypothetical protein
MSTTKNGKTDLVTRVGHVLAGAQKHFTNASQSLTFEGGAQTMTVSAVLTQLQLLVSNRAAVVAAQAAATAKVAAETAQMPALIALFNAFVALVRFQFGSDPTVLADFGLEPRKVPTPLTTEQKAAAAAKREATRKARGTTSAKAKKAIKGNVTATLVVTPDAPSAAAPAVPAAATTPPKS